MLEPGAHADEIRLHAVRDLDHGHGRDDRPQQCKRRAHSAPGVCPEPYGANLRSATGERWFSGERFNAEAAEEHAEDAGHRVFRVVLRDAVVG